MNNSIKNIINEIIIQKNIIKKNVTSMLYEQI